MLLNSNIDGWEQQAPQLLCNKYLWKISINVIAFASYGNQNHVYSLEVFYATTTPGCWSTQSRMVENTTDLNFMKQGLMKRF